MNVNIIITILISIMFIILEVVLIKINRKLKMENAYIKWQLDFYKEQYDKLGKILLDKEKQDEPRQSNKKWKRT